MVAAPKPDGRKSPLHRLQPQPRDQLGPDRRFRPVKRLAGFQGHRGFVDRLVLEHLADRIGLARGDEQVRGPDADTTCTERATGNPPDLVDRISRADGTDRVGTLRTIYRLRAD